MLFLDRLQFPLPGAMRQQHPKSSSRDGRKGGVDFFRRSGDALGVTVPAVMTVQAIVERARRLHPTLHIVARAEGIEQMHTLHNHGVYEVVQPEFEAGLEMTRQALVHLQISASAMQRFTDAMHQELYALLYQTYKEYRAIAQLHHAPRLLDLTWVTLPPESPLE